MTKYRQLSLKIVSKSDEKNADLQFWLGKTPEERIEAVEFLRSQYYVLSGYENVPRIVHKVELRQLHK